MPANAKGYRGGAMAMPDVQQMNAGMIGFDRLYGLEILECGHERARAQVRITDDVRQPMGLLHGGVLAAVAESLASVATQFAVYDQGCSAVGLANNTSFLRPFTEGTVHVEALRLHRGRTTWVWDVRFSDDDGRLCALTRMTIAVRSAP